MMPIRAVEAAINDVITSIYMKYKTLKANNSDVIFDILTSLEIIKRAKQIFAKEDPILELNFSDENFVVVGDIHGNLESLINIFQAKGDPSTTKFIFLGDYVDRGKNSSEVIVLLYAFKVLYPRNIYMIRGNHEFKEMNDHYGFKEECYKRIKVRKNDKYLYAGKAFYEKVTDSFQYLPLGAILNGDIFCVHGGITALVETREKLKSIQKVGIQYTKFDAVQAELMWNDPDKKTSEFEHSPRGLGCIFGKDALNNFLEKMKFKTVIRGHQNEMNGYNWTFGENEGILTVFSSSNYCGTENDGAVALVSPEGKVTTCKFEVKPTITLPENVIMNCFAFMDDVTLNPDLNIDEMPQLI